MPLCQWWCNVVFYVLSASSDVLKSHMHVLEYFLGGLSTSLHLALLFRVQMLFRRAMDGLVLYDLWSTDAPAAVAHCLVGLGS
jgi:hypothetical protein